ncbi:MAG: bacteriohemerythrin [Rhodospirillaceae bacterium]
MPLMVWTQSLSVGVAQFDNEHKKLITLINDLFDAIQSGRGRQMLGSVLDELIEYTQTHFAHEEYQLKVLGFPGYEAHKREHEALGKKVLEIQRKYHGGATATLSMELMSFLKTWLVDHIQGVDALYVAFVKERGLH